MKRLNIFFFILIAVFQTSFASPLDDHKTLEIGAAAPAFSLPCTDGKTYTLSSFKSSKVLVVVFTCNHCPTAQAYEDRLIQLTKDYAGKGVSVIAIMPNDPKSITLNELDYSDMGDSFEEMKIRAKQKKFNFPYLYDGATQAVSRAYGPSTTPHVFIFDKDRKLRFQGRIDDVEKPSKTPNTHDTRDAIDALLANKEIASPTTKVFGCSVKWAEKEELVKQSNEKWAKLPVTLDSLDEAGIKDLVKNNSDKLRLINIWATWCGPCVEEYPSFIEMYRMYKSRDFEFVSVSADDPDKYEKVLKFLKSKNSAVKNYLFGVDNKYKLIEAIDPKWQGALPYTILVEPGGKIIYAKQGAVDVAEMKKLIVDHPMIGRFYK